MEQEQHATLWGPAYGPEHQNGEEPISDIHSLYLTPENLLDYSPLPQTLDLSDSSYSYLNDLSDDIDISTYGLLEFPDRPQQNEYVLNHELGGRFLGNHEHRTSWGTEDLSYLSNQEPSRSSDTNYSPLNTEYYYQSANSFTPEPWGALSSLSSSFCSSDVDDSIGYLSRPYSLVYDDISVTSQQSLQQGEEYSNLGPRWQHARQVLALNSTSDQTESQPDPEKPLRCVECNIGFRHRRNLERHKSTTHADTISRYVCRYESCDGKGFVRKDKLIDHLRQHHGERIPSRSSTLPGPTSIPPRLALSFRGPTRSGQMLSSSVPDSSSQSKRQPTLFFCKFEDCIRYKRGFRTLSDLQRHQRDVHDVPSGNEPDKGYRCASKNCPTPDKTWSRLDNLRSHIRNLHGDEDIQDLIRGYHIKMSKER